MAAANSGGAEKRVATMGLKLPEAPTPFGAYVEAVRTGRLLFFSGMLATSGREVAVAGVVGAGYCCGDGAGGGTACGAQCAGTDSEGTGVAGSGEQGGAAGGVHRGDGGIHGACEGGGWGVGVVPGCVWGGEDVVADGDRGGEFAVGIGGGAGGDCGGRGVRLRWGADDGQCVGEFPVEAFFAYSVKLFL